MVLENHSSISARDLFMNHKKKIYSLPSKNYFLSIFFKGTLDISEIIITFIAYACWFRLALFLCKQEKLPPSCKVFFGGRQNITSLHSKTYFRYTRKINTFMQSVFIETYKKYVTCIQRFIGNKV